MTAAVLVFTRDSLEKILAAGGSGNWAADSQRVSAHEYIVAISPGPKGAESKRAFLVGRARNLRCTPVADRRILIGFDEYARVDALVEWDRSQNPVRYSTLESCGINPARLKWLPFPTEGVDLVSSAAPLTIDQAKRGLAKTLGISPDKIEITIKA